MYEDKTLVCKECGKEFVFTAGEQEFYAERGFQNEPQRCKACRDARKNAARSPREYFTAVCANCGGEARVPFEPKTDRPVYCSECFAKMKENNGRSVAFYNACLNENIGHFRRGVPYVLEIYNYDKRFNSRLTGKGAVQLLAAAPRRGDLSTDV